MNEVHWTRRVIAKLVADYLTQLVADPPETESARMFLDVCEILKLTDENIRELRVAVEIAANGRDKLANLPEYWIDVRKAWKNKEMRHESDEKRRQGPRI